MLSRRAAARRSGVVVGEGGCLCALLSTHEGKYCFGGGGEEEESRGGERGGRIAAEREEQQSIDKREREEIVKLVV